MLLLVQQRGVHAPWSLHTQLAHARCARDCISRLTRTPNTRRLADLKLREPASQMLLAAAEAAGPQLVAGLLHKRAAGAKNPKARRRRVRCQHVVLAPALPACGACCI